MTIDTAAGDRPVNTKALALTYAVLPIALALALADRYLLGRSLLWWIPVQPESWTLWVMLFGMPHVIGSLLGFADREYLRAYGAGRIALFAGGILVGTLALYAVDQRLLFAVYLVSIVHHTVAQQFGIALAILGMRADALWRIWKWSSVVSGGIIYFLLYMEPVIYLNNAWAPDGESKRLHDLLMLGYGAYGIAVVAGVLVMVRAMKARRPSAAAVFFMLGTISMGGFLLLFLDLGYFAFAIISGRVVHEMGAWVVYLQHDANRHRAGGDNVIYRALGFTGISIPVMSLAVSYGLGMTAGWWYAAGHYQLVNVAIVYFSLLHYHMEALIWRRGSMHRQHLRFAG